MDDAKIMDEMVLSTDGAPDSELAKAPVADNSVTKQTARIPFLRWPGGKRWFVASYHHLVPSTYNRYIEPFLGGGSMVFHLRPTMAVLSDVNVDVVRVFDGVRQFPELVTEKLEVHHIAHCRDHYLAIRDSEPVDLASQAARIIYLNRTCFNGIYRLNRQGRFNVPMGSRSQVVFATDNFVEASKLLLGAEIRHSDFETVVDEASDGDLLFADPPYTVRHNTNGFVLYNENLFSWSDQIRLADALQRARARGVQILLTNAAHESVIDLYTDRGFSIRQISRFSPIAAQSDNRKQFEELVISA